MSNVKIKMSDLVSQYLSMEIGSSTSLGKCLEGELPWNTLPISSGEISGMFLDMSKIFKLSQCLIKFRLHFG